MSRDRYATKAHTEARVNGQTITGKLSIRRKEGDGPHPLSSLLIAARGHGFRGRDETELDGPCT